jgi:hypothetical protein
MHPRCFGREQVIDNPWHYVPALMRKPGASRNGAPFKGWVLPGALGRVRQKLSGSVNGDRQVVHLLNAVLSDAWWRPRRHARKRCKPGCTAAR